MRFLAREHNGGFTLVSLLTTVSILGIILAIGIPYFQSSALRSTLGAYANHINASTKLARSEAMKRKTDVAICPSADGSTCTTGNWNQGWIVYVKSSLEVIEYRQALDSNYIIDSTVDDIVFQSNGTGASQSNITICREKPSAGSFENVLTVSATGRTILNQTETGTCTI